MKTFQKPLTQGEETEYVRMLREGNGDEARLAKQILVERNLRLVAHIVKKYTNSDEDMEDLISVGCIGLIKAVDSFDEKKGRLATYACRCIDNELLMLFRGKKKYSKEISLYESIGQDKEGNEIRLMDVIEHRQTDILDRMVLSDNVRKLYAVLQSALTSREKEILRMRYGLNGSPEMTQNEVGARLGISRSYVSRIEKKALLKLRQEFET